jgi:hypothetical protein
MQVVRLYTDAQGETHFEEVAVPLAAADFAPPAPPVNLSAFAPASRYGFMSVPPGYCASRKSVNTSAATTRKTTAHRLLSNQLEAH